MTEQKSELRLQVDEAVEVLNRHIDEKPEIGIILGTGLGGLVNHMDVDLEIPYDEIPHFVLSTVEYHTGKLIFGRISDKPVVAMQGRFHYYEGYTMQQITFPVRVMKYLGAESLIVSNACGSVNPYFRKGNIMVIDDHINLLGDNPLIGANDDDMGLRFPDMSEPYDQGMITLMEKIALELGIRLYKGVYAAMSGPSLETRAEYRMLRNIGADVIGMSTIPEVIVANHMKMKAMGLSIITDECYPDALEPVDIEQIIQTASETEVNLTKLIHNFIKEY